MSSDLVRPLPVSRDRFVAGPARPYLAAISGLRGITISCVVLGHFSGLFTTLLPEMAYPIAVCTGIGFRVDMLFLLSGFISAYVLVKPGERFDLQAHVNILKGRLARLYPSFFAAFIVLGLLIAAARWKGVAISGNYPVEALPLRLLLLQAWPGCLWATPTWNYPAWFVSALWFAYLFAFPCGWLFFRAQFRSALLLSAVIGCIAGGLAIKNSPALFEFQVVLHGSCVFLGGMALCALHLKSGSISIQARAHTDKIAILFLAVAGLSPLFGPQSLSGLTRLLVLASPLLLLGLAGGSSVTSMVLSSQPMQRLGTISYGIYISHAIVQKVLKVLLVPEVYAGSALALRVALVFGCLVLIVAAGGVLHYTVETPCIRYFKRRMHLTRPELSEA